ncbi:MAG: hypothetical protein B6I34_00680 [Anaerolineaceae bacterium 4572_32.1]|nr:MAG: hypothetical protein B6I34_00680 [Anaerolineaceae bacterium 4572_32.1]
MAAIKFGVAQRPKHGQKIPGDAVFIHDAQAPDAPCRQVLVAVVDGLGSGETAAQVSSQAVDCIKDNLNAPLKMIIEQCHLALRGSRGAAMMVMRVDLAANQVSFVGVGNVGVRAHSVSGVHPVSKNGTLGYRLPKLKEFSYNYTPGDLFVLFSDGVSNHFSLDERDISPVDFRDNPQGLAEAIINRYGKDDDDITAAVVW